MWHVTHHCPSVDHDRIDDSLGIETYLQFLEKGRLRKRWRRLQVGLHTQKLSPSLSRTPQLHLHRLLPSLPHLLVLCTHQVRLLRARPYSHWFCLHRIVAACLARISHCWPATMDLPNQKVRAFENPQTPRSPGTLQKRIHQIRTFHHFKTS